MTGDEALAREKVFAWLCGGMGWPGFPDAGGKQCGADSRKEPGDVLRIADCPEDADDASGGDAGEKVLEIKVQYGCPPAMGGGVADDRMTGAKAVHCGMKGDAVEDFVEDLPLHLLEGALGDF